jgi:hypothetical protein
LLLRACCYIDGYSTYLHQTATKTPQALAQFGTVHLPRALAAFLTVTGAEVYSSGAAGASSTASVDADINFALAALNLNTTQEWLPLAMRMVMLYGANAPALCQLLRAVERVAAYLTMCVPRSKTRSDRYRAALEELGSIAAVGGVAASLLPPSLRLSADEAAAMRLVIEDADLYQKKKCFQLVVRRLDMAMHDAPSPPCFDGATVDHVLPQEPEARSQWLKDFDEGARAELTHSLGNLVLLLGRKNSKAARFDFAEKYFRDSDGAYSMPNFKVTQTVMGEERWTRTWCARGSASWSRRCAAGKGGTCEGGWPAASSEALARATRRTRGVHTRVCDSDLRFSKPHR